MVCQKTDFDRCPLIDIPLSLTLNSHQKLKLAKNTVQIRQTKQRQIIEMLLKEANRPLFPKELLDKAKKHLPSVGIATVFRNLKKMVDEGKVEVVNVPGDSPRYEHPDFIHHHHFKCSECESVFKVKGCPGDLEKLLPQGFQLTEHEITLFGLCADCSSNH